MLQNELERAAIRKELESKRESDSGTVDNRSIDKINRRRDHDQQILASSSLGRGAAGEFLCPRGQCTVAHGTRNFPEKLP